MVLWLGSAGTKQFLYIKYNYLNFICGALKRSSNFLYLYLITNTYFKIEIKKRSQKQSRFTYKIRVMICGLLPKLDVHEASVLGFPCGQSTNELRLRQGVAQRPDLLNVNKVWFDHIRMNWVDLRGPARVPKNNNQNNWIHST
mgnify:FL=1